MCFTHNMSDRIPKIPFDLNGVTVVRLTLRLQHLAFSAQKTILYSTEFHPEGINELAGSLCLCRLSGNKKWEEF
jgi:hypothetical protein